MTREELNFEMTSEKGIPGKKKAAILFGELGAGAESVLECLNDDEKHMLLKAMRKLGTKYNPNNPSEVRDEIRVLETLERFGKVRNIYRDVAGERIAFEKKMAAPTAQIRNAIDNHPDQVASVLRKKKKKDK